MPHIRHRTTMPAQTTHAEFGRGAWIVIGAVTIAVGAVSHAVAGLLGIVRDMMRAEPRDGPGQSESPAVAPALMPHEAAGWVLIAGASIALGALSHAAANLAGLAKEILRGGTVGSP